MGKLATDNNNNNSIISTFRKCPQWIQGLVGFFIVIVIALAILGAYNQYSESKGSNSSEEVHEHEVREHTVSWDELDRIYNVSSSYTDLQKDERWKEFKNKKIKWTGTVTDIKDSFLGGLSITVRMNRTTLVADAIVHLRDSEKNKALNIRKEDKVHFSGVLKDWGSIVPFSIEDGIIHNKP
jgi:hypothetical protein